MADVLDMDSGLVLKQSVASILRMWKEIWKLQRGASHLGYFVRGLRWWMNLK